MRRLSLILFAVLLFAPSAHAQGIITTVAGTGIRGFNGDNIPATSAHLAAPVGAAFDASGNLYIADLANNRIRKVDAATGIITTVAGTGAFGFNGDNQPATSAQLASPFGVAFDARGNLYIADFGNNRIRKVDATTGIITTVAGTGVFGFNGDNIPATSALLAFPFGVGVDASGNLYIADRNNQRIRKVDPATGIITTVAGTGVRGFTGDGGPATSALLAFPFGVAFDASGNFYIADTLNQRIRKVSSPNRPPVANAGPDQVLECTSPAGAQVMVDGSASVDPDGDPITFTWTGPFPEGGGRVTGATPTVTLPLGTSTISLVVNDGRVDSAPDTVVVTVKVGVVGLQPPLAALVREGDTVPLPDHAFKQGRTLPLKLQLFCGTTALTDVDVAAPKIMALFRAGDAVNLETIDPDAGAANDGGLLFRYSAPNWVYNLSTQGLSAGTYLITLEMPDGLRYTAAFVLR